MPINPPPAYDQQQEEAVRVQLIALKILMEQREEARVRGDQVATCVIDNRIVATMRLVGDAYPAGETRIEWYRKADVYERGNTEEKEHILMPLAKGLGILIATPFALAAGVIFAAGAIIYGAGKTVMGLGNLLTGGVFR
ncbi:hypothetical protein BDV93DRAFT_155774 [Ceratobasidium sp. AG-I]|nr:hypothetical protein BDV93DRAFT_155774 [Ceratobasidium sp. AG-I]